MVCGGSWYHSGELGRDRGKTLERSWGSKSKHLFGLEGYARDLAGFGRDLGKVLEMDGFWERPRCISGWKSVPLKLLFYGTDS